MTSADIWDRMSAEERLCMVPTGYPELWRINYAALSPEARAYIDWAIEHSRLMAAVIARCERHENGDGV